jgi:hypothetical protein
MTKYGKKAAAKVRKVMHERKLGILKSKPTWKVRFELGVERGPTG